jgi:hypothetical protein
VTQKTSVVVNKLFELVKRDHGGCEDNSCDIGLAIRHGYDAIATVQFSGCGAACVEFDKLYSKLPKSYTRAEYSAQIDLFLKEMNSVQCLKCNAWCRSEFEYPTQCDSCLAELPVKSEMEEE